MAFEAPYPPQISSDSDDFCLPGLEVQQELLLSLKHWQSAATIVQRLSDEGAEVYALALNPQAGGYVLRCKVRAISPSRARAFVADLGVLAVGAACVEHFILAKAPAHAGA